MSSLRNAVKRITHKERSQPTNRAHLGILEKKKDYKVRSKDYHKKQDVITNLRRKAAARNPDEFYHKMKNSELHEGRHRKLEAAIQKERINEIGPEAVKLMKSQDLSYVRMQKLRDMRKTERMQTSLQYLGDNPETTEDFEDGAVKKKKHTIFVDSREKANNFSVADHFDTLPELAGRSFNRLRKETLLKIGSNKDGYYDDDQEQLNVLSEKAQQKQKFLEKKQAKILSKARSQAYAEMEARTKRIELMKNAEAHLVTEKIFASKGRKRKVKGAENGKPAIYKFRRKRAR